MCFRIILGLFLVIQTSQEYLRVFPKALRVYLSFGVIQCLRFLQHRSWKDSIDQRGQGGTESLSNHCNWFGRGYVMIDQCPKNFPQKIIESFWAPRPKTCFQTWSRVLWASTAINNQTALKVALFNGNLLAKVDQHNE